MTGQAVLAAKYWPLFGVLAGLSHSAVTESDSVFRDLEISHQRLISGKSITLHPATTSLIQDNIRREYCYSLRTSTEVGGAKTGYFSIIISKMLRLLSTKNKFL